MNRKEDPNVEKIKPEIYYMTSMVFFLTKHWNKSSQEFVELDKKYEILSYLNDGYESFHLTGDVGVAEELEQYIRDQGGDI